MTGAVLRRLRDGLGLSQPGLAARLGVHWNTVARYERGELPIPEPVARLARLVAGGALDEPHSTSRPRRRGARAPVPGRVPARGRDAVERRGYQREGEARRPRARRALLP